MRSYQTAVNRALGLGSAKNGFIAWWRQRVSAVLLIPLLLWLGVFVALLAGADHATAHAWIANPINSVLMIATLAVLLFHTAVGVQVIIEDYVETEGLKAASILLVHFGCFLLTIAGSLAVVRIALGS
ncbi:succinate dehydrogenase hydrophobic membrane anchor protein [Halorhodospira halochloris]|uniref:Succinate dehydrogenase hydrophobic membrane anchor subunit n=1 Tax=Halorhodospira halochloris TaxID=1052 RepID=A0A0X8XBD9_HALHR|nr:succinate dehydrogenase, hydrophobic membrane anchor protein [Halorhodospira halochloris]MBK1652025.1 succinate dehydrogenase, hydrophobic membrane anchor protein [Halorhodospira halochloris]MCG5547877.1 succinate dehydrogenase, hydrophobic membrane anchor protein [Halorhodospira halochloris]BAU58323.1 succinate dehydrogenase hydrophobic membrane anchor protein [Halorhodospira halochloris]